MSVSSTSQEILNTLAGFFDYINSVYVRLKHKKAAQPAIMLASGSATCQRTA